MLLLDEATSHLDIGNEATISKTIRELGLPVLLIAHRPETIASADRVIELVNGVARELLAEGAKSLEQAHGLPV